MGFVTQIREVGAKCRTLIGHPAFVFGIGILLLFLSEKMNLPLPRDLSLAVACLLVLVGVYESFPPTGTWLYWVVFAVVAGGFTAGAFWYFGAALNQGHFFPPSVHDCYKEDFSEFSSLSDDKTLSSTDHSVAPVNVQARVVFDFYSNSLILVIYLPRNSDSVAAGKFLATLAKTMVSETNAKVEVGVKPPGDAEMSDNMQATFTNRVFLYYEDNLSIPELAEIETAFKNEGLIITLRGDSYATGQWLSKKSTP